jgi:hypothetical protein
LVGRGRGGELTDKDLLFGREKGADILMITHTHHLSPLFSILPAPHLDRLGGINERERKRGK